MSGVTKQVLKLGTRGSRLARWQSEFVAASLKAHVPGLEIELVEIKTHGDRDRNSPLSAIGGMGLFTKEIQRALLDGVVDLAVHSLKDLPTKGPDGLVLGAVPAREGAFDGLIAPIYLTLANMPPGSSLGTSSQRRRAQILHFRPDLSVVELRGNVETRLAAATEGRLDAVILAEAGLNRLGLAHHVTETLAPPRFLPAVGQGALGIECRADDSETRQRLGRLDHPETHRAVLAERRVLFDLEGGCTIPLAAWARQVGDVLQLDAAVFDLDGREKIGVSVEGDPNDPEGLGDRAAFRLRQLGAAEVLERIRPT
jgi:hydroxymethylbilane synthase